MKTTLISSKPIPAGIGGIVIAQVYASEEVEVRNNPTPVFQKDINVATSHYFASAYQKMINKLITQTRSLKANAVFELQAKVEKHEGSGMDLFQLNLQGMAVKLNRFGDMMSRFHGKRYPETFEESDLDRVYRKNKITEQLEKGSLKLNDSTWEFVTKNSMKELSGPILSLLQRVESSAYLPDKHKKKNYSKSLAFLESLAVNDQKKVLYDRILSEESEGFVTVLIRMVEELQLADYRMIGKCMRNRNDERSKRRMLQLTVLSKSKYYFEDIREIDNLISAIKRSFTPKHISIKIQHGIRDGWLCSCGEKNSGSRFYCPECGKDLYGFTPDEVNPVKSVDVLEHKRNLIANAFKGQKSEKYTSIKERVFSFLSMNF